MLYYNFTSYCVLTDVKLDMILKCFKFTYMVEVDTIDEQNLILLRTHINSRNILYVDQYGAAAASNLSCIINEFSGEQLRVSSLARVRCSIHMVKM